MPICYQEETPYKGHFAIWHITESESDLMKSLNLSESEWYELNLIKGHGRRSNWLAARNLVKEMWPSIEEIVINKDEYGKPHVEDSPMYISISHSADRAAALISEVPCGIDIQQPVAKIARILPRIATAEEQSAIHSLYDLTTMHAIWGSKESMYKAYGRRLLDFKKHMKVLDPARLVGGQSLGMIVQEDEVLSYEIYGKLHDHFILIYCFEAS